MSGLRETLDALKDLTHAVEVLDKCREKKELSSGESAVLCQRYEFLLLGEDNLLWKEQKQRKIVNIVRANSSTLIAALEDLLAVEKKVFDLLSGDTTPAAADSPVTVPNDSSSVTAISLFTRAQRDLQRVLQLREESFRAHMSGRSHSDRSLIARDHIAAMNFLFDTYHSFLAFASAPASSRGGGLAVNDSSACGDTHATSKKHRPDIDLRSVYLDGIDLSRLDLSRVEFANNSIRDVNFTQCTFKSIDQQLAFVTHFSSTVFDEHSRRSFVAFKLAQCVGIVHEIEAMIEECKQSLDCLLNFFLFACTKPFDVQMTCRPLSLDDLRRTVFSLMNDVDINRINASAANGDDSHSGFNAESGSSGGGGGETSWSYLWVNEHRVKVFSLDRDRLCEAVQYMLLSRDFQLPEEVLSLSIDRKTYNFEEEISSSKLFLQSIQQTLSWLTALSVSDAERSSLHHLQSDIERVLQLQSNVLAERSQRRLENNIFRRNIYLATLNADEDVALRQGPTERLAEVMRLSKVDLQRYYDSTNANNGNGSNQSPLRVQSGDVGEKDDRIFRRSVDSTLSDSLRNSFSQIRSASPTNVTQTHSQSQSQPTEASSPGSDDRDFSSPYLVDLSFTDLSKVDFTKIDFTGVYSSVTKEQEATYLTANNRQQRYFLMHEYARLGDARAMTDVITQCDLDVNQCDSRGTSALMHACIARQPRTAKELIRRHQAKVDIRTPNGWDVISTLCAMRDAQSGLIDPISRDLVEFLVKEAKAVVSVHNAARLGDLARIKKFSLKELQSLCPATEFSVAHIAAKDDNVDILTYLVEKKFDFESALFLSSTSASAAAAAAAQSEKLHSHSQESASSLSSLSSSSQSIRSPGNSFAASLFGFALRRPSATLSHADNGSTHGADPSSSSLFGTPSSSITQSITMVETERPSALFVAAEHARVSAAVFLFQHVPSLRNKSFRHLSPAKVALRCDSYELVRELWHSERQSQALERQGFRSSVMDLEVAIALREREWIESQLEAVRVQQSMTMYQGNVQQALLYACKYNWTEMVLWLVTNCEASLSFRYEKEFQQRAVDVVCSLGYGALMSLLLAFADSEATIVRSKDGHYVSKDTGASSSVSSQKQSHSSFAFPSAFATSRTQPHQQRRGFSLNESVGSCAPLIFTAIARRRWDIVELLLTQAVNLTIVYDGRTALHALLASSEGDKARAQQDPQYLSHDRRVELVRQMLSKGASVVDRDKDGQTALHYAARTSDELSVIVLRAFVSMRNLQGESALDIAQRSNVDMSNWKDEEVNVASMPDNF